MTFNPVAPHEIMEGDVYYIAHFGIPEMHYSLQAGAISAAQSSLLMLSQRGLVFRTKEEARAFVSAAIIPWAAHVAQRTPPEDCITCNGTGEGQFDGQSCPVCRGRGY